ncbi:dromaiocalcin-1-like [Chaetodon auriga]|uniref:dromaiocalcin-1-like n=1 Tax=Chaetodon auriga TaxID=39042 RepID=UPI004032E0B6
MTWEEAMMQCHHQQSNLVSVDSESALTKTLQASREAQTDRMWIGLRYLADNWLWEKGNKMKYKAWSQSKEPECPAWSHRCGVLSLQDHHWDSWDCLDKLYFACN